jgi:hypothetical protein
MCPSWWHMTKISIKHLKKWKQGAETWSQGSCLNSWSCTKVAAKVSCWRANNNLSRGQCSSKFQIFWFIIEKCGNKGIIQLVLPNMTSGNGQ